jgi:hypothetical protein
MSDVDDILTRIETLLTKYDHPGQAGVIASLKALREREPNAHRTMIQGVDVWGGAGAVWEVCLTWRVPQDPSTREDERAFRSLIIALADSMDREGISTERSRYIARIFRECMRKRP